MYIIKLDSRNSDVWNINFLNQNFKSSFDETVVIEYSIDIDQRSWGIASFSPSIAKISLAATLENDSETEDIDIELDLKTFEIITSNSDINGFYPTNIDIDFKTKKIDITF